MDFEHLGNDQTPVTDWTFPEKLNNTSTTWVGREHAWAVLHQFIRVLVFVYIYSTISEI